MAWQQQCWEGSSGDLQSGARLLPALDQDNHNIFFIINVNIVVDINIVIDINIVVVIIIRVKGGLIYRPYSNLRRRARMMAQDANH